MTEARHADCLHVLTAVSMIANSERVNAALEMLKAMTPVEPCAFAEPEHLEEMQHIAQKAGYWQTIIACTSKNTPNKVPLYTPEQSK